MSTPHTVRILRLIADHGPMTSTELRASLTGAGVEVSDNTLFTTLKQLRKADRLSWDSGLGTQDNPIRSAITEKGRAHLAKKEVAK